LGSCATHSRNQGVAERSGKKNIKRKGQKPGKRDKSSNGNDKNSQTKMRKKKGKSKGAIKGSQKKKETIVQTEKVDVIDNLQDITSGRETARGGRENETRMLI